MKPTTIRNTTRWITEAAAIGLLTVVVPAFGQAKDKGDKLLLMGVVSKVETDSLLIRNPEGKKPEQKIGLTKETKFAFVGFQGLGKSADKPEVGFAVKVNLTKDDNAMSILFSPDFPPLQEIPNKHSLTAEELFKATDLNKNGQVDYVEFATKIFQSYKHLPDRYKTKFDVDGNDILDLKEFTAALEREDWWRLSRKSAEEWLIAADKDKSGQLEGEEAKSVVGSAHGKFDKLFEKLDKDKSGGLSASELKRHLDSVIQGKSTGSTRR